MLQETWVRHMNTKNDSLENEEKLQNNVNEILHWLEAAIIAIALAFLIRSFIIEPVKVEGSSMENTLQNSDRLIVYKFGYLIGEPKRKDIIILKYQEGMVQNLMFLKNVPYLNKLLPKTNEVDYVKRVIGLPGDEVDIKNNNVYVNGEKLDEPYAKGITTTRGMNFPMTVPKDSVFVLGDNREHSSDSRMIGFIDYKKIKGKAVLRIYPLKSFGSIYKNNLEEK